MLKGVTSMARALRTRPSILQTVQALANQETERYGETKNPFIDFIVGSFMLVDITGLNTILLDSRWACARYDLAVQPDLKQYWALLHAANFSAAKKGNSVWAGALH